MPTLTDTNDNYRVTSASGPGQLDGGLGTDTLKIGIFGTILDSYFTGVTNFEAIKLGTGSYELNLGANAKAAFTGGLVNIWCRSMDLI